MMKMMSWNGDEPLEENDLRVSPTAAGMKAKKDDSVKRAFFRLGVGEIDDGIKTHCREKALRLLKGNVLDAIVDDKKNAEKWNFTAVPLECFCKTMDDLLMAFLHWTKLEDEDGCYDVSKAFGRLGDYAEWMYVRRDELRVITNDSIQPARKAWNIMTSQSDRTVIWWLDLSSVECLEELTAVDSLRFFVWFAHSLIFRPQVHHHGVVIVINLAQVHLGKFMSMLPANLTRKLEHFTIDILPIQTKKLYVTGSPIWCNLFMTMSKPLLSADMRRRVVALENPKELHHILGIDCIPEGFGRTFKETHAECPVREQKSVIPREIFCDDADVPLVLPEEPAPLLREWQS